MNVETLKDLFLYELQAIYSVEQELVGALDEFSEQARIESLDDLPDSSVHKAAATLFSEHRDETETHVERLEEVFEAVDARPDTREVQAIDALVVDKERFNNVVLNDALRSLVYVDAGEKIENTEITAYRSLLQLANALDLPDEAVDPLEANLRDEEETLQELRDLSEGDDIDSLLAELAEREPRT